MNKKNSLLFSTASPALVLLSGLLFCLATANLIGFRWHQTATIIFYCSLAVWIGLIVWIRRKDLQPARLPDVLFFCFMSLITVSSASQWADSDSVKKYMLYLPFMAVLPYCCGRVMIAADLQRLWFLLRISGLAMVPITILDAIMHRPTSIGHARGIFFGQDHGALLLGTLLAASLVAHAATVLSDNKPLSISKWRVTGYIAALGAVTVMTVWVSARGALLSGIISVLVLCLTARWKPIAVRVGLALYIIGLVYFSMMSLSNQKFQFYANLLQKPESGFAREIASTNSAGKPFFGEISCKPFRDGIDSRAMRLVLYREATGIFLSHPLKGVGAANFGSYSCSGIMGFPHSTILQAVAELGLIGGGTYLLFLAVLLIALLRVSIDNTSQEQSRAAWLGLALLVFYCCSDQIYGNYFMSSGTYLIAGFAAAQQAQINSTRLWKKQR